MIETPFASMTTMMTNSVLGQFPAVLGQAIAIGYEEQGSQYDPTTTLLVVLGAIVFLVLLFGVNWFTRFGRIARATAKESVRQPVFLAMLATSLIILLVNVWVPYFSMGDDTKMFKECGISTILICGGLLAVWIASTTITEELEGKTAMTLLSKPITRRDFILGKFMGILQTVAMYMVVVGITFIALTPYKTYYDTREAGKRVELLKWETMEMGSNVVIDIPYLGTEVLDSTLQLPPILLLTFMEIAILASIAVAIATRLPMAVNFTICLTIFVVAHLVPVLVRMSVEQNRLEIVSFFARLLGTIFPALDTFSMSAAITQGSAIPGIYVGTIAIYTLCFCSAMVLVSFILFEDRDLA